MTFEEFDNFQNRLLEEVRQMGSTKGKEYAYDFRDRFQNFNEDAIALEVDRLLVAWIFINKHLRSLRSFIKHKRTFSNEGIRGRIIDIIVYMTLIAGMIEEDCISKESYTSEPFTGTISDPNFIEEENKDEEKLKTIEKNKTEPIVKIQKGTDAWPPTSGIGTRI